MGTADYDADQLLAELREDYSDDELYELGKAIYVDMPAEWRAELLGEFGETADLVEWLQQQDVLSELREALAEIGIGTYDLKKFRRKLDKIIQIVDGLEEE